MRPLAPLWMNAFAFCKHRLACGLAIFTSIYSQKSVIHQVFTYEREREKEREGARDREKSCELPPCFSIKSEAVALIPVTIMLPVPC